MQTMETIGALWFNAIAMAALKATFILAAAGVIAELMRDRSPAVRFRVWVGALLCAAVLPLLSLGYTGPALASQLAKRECLVGV